MKVEVDEIHTKNADDRGRLYVGTDKANKKVTYAILEVEDENESGSE